MFVLHIIPIASAAWLTVALVSGCESSSLQGKVEQLREVRSDNAEESASLRRDIEAVKKELAELRTGLGRAESQRGEAVERKRADVNRAIGETQKAIEKQQGQIEEARKTLKNE